MKNNTDLKNSKSNDLSHDHKDLDSEDQLDLLYEAVGYTFGWSDSSNINLDLNPNISYKIVKTMKANPHVCVGECEEEMPSNIVKESQSDLSPSDGKSWPPDNSLAAQSMAPTELGSLKLKTQQLSREKADLEMIISAEFKKRLDLHRKVEELSLELKNSKMEFQDYKHSQGKELESKLWEVQVLNKKLEEADLAIRDQVYAYEADKKLKWRQLEWKQTPLKGKRNDLRSMIQEKRIIREEMLDHIKRITFSANCKSKTVENRALGSTTFNIDNASFKSYLSRSDM